MHIPDFACDVVTSGRIVQEERIPVFDERPASARDGLFLLDIDSLSKVGVDEVLDTRLDEGAAICTHEHALLFEGFQIAPNGLVSYGEALGKRRDRGALLSAASMAVSSAERLTMVG